MASLDHFFSALLFHLLGLALGVHSFEQERRGRIQVSAVLETYEMQSRGGRVGLLVRLALRSPLPGKCAGTRAGGFSFLISFKSKRIQVGRLISYSVYEKKEK